MLSKSEIKCSVESNCPYLLYSVILYIQSLEFSVKYCALYSQKLAPFSSGFTHETG